MTQKEKMIKLMDNLLKVAMTISERICTEKANLAV